MASAVKAKKQNNCQNLQANIDLLSCFFLSLNAKRFSSKN